VDLNGLFGAVNFFRLWDPLWLKYTDPSRSFYTKVAKGTKRLGVSAHEISLLRQGYAGHGQAALFLCLMAEFQRRFALLCDLGVKRIRFLTNPHG
jgi:hypothetical protein